MTRLSELIDDLHALCDLSDEIGQLLPCDLTVDITGRLDAEIRVICAEIVRERPTGLIRDAQAVLRAARNFGGFA